MNKQTLPLPGTTGTWDSFVSKYQPDSSKVLDNMFTKGSTNFVTDQTGMIDKRQGGVKWNRTDFAGPAADSYDAIFESGAQHYLRVGQGVLSASTGNGLFTTIESGFSTVGNFEFATYQNRVYGDNGINSPIVYDTVTSYGGVSYSFTTGKTKIMGAQPPLTAPVAGTPTSGGDVPPGPHRYEVTFLYYATQEESNGSPPSNVEVATGVLASDTTQVPHIPFVVAQVVDGFNLKVSNTSGMLAGDTVTQGGATTTIVTVTDLTHLNVLSTSGWVAANNTIPLTSIPIGGYGVVARNIYRDNNDGVFLLVGTINDNTTTTFTDSAFIGSTPTPIPFDNNVPPTFSKIALWLDALWIAPTGNTNTLLFSNAGEPDVFGGNNFVVCQSDDIITAIYVYNGTLYVWGLHSFGSIQGTTPDTFHYYNISNTVGCVDNRSIEIRSIVSIPTLWWLSNKGIYYSNGYTVEYGSDLIQDLVNLNLSQVNYTLNQNVQNSQAQFAGGTSTPGIDITTIPGTITTSNPEADFSTTADWLGGSIVTNLKTSDIPFAEVPTQFVPSPASGVLGGSAQISGLDITLPTASPWTGDGSLAVQSYFPSSQTTRGAVSFIPPRTGNITQIQGSIDCNTSQLTGNTLSATVGVYTNSFAAPGANLFTSSPFVFTNASGIRTLTASCSVAATAGTQYWIVVILSYSSPFVYNIGYPTVSFDTTNVYSAGGSPAVRGWNGFGWVAVPASFSGPAVSMASTYTFVVTPILPSGSWTSPIYDSGAIDGIAGNIIESGSYPSSTTGSVTVFGSPNPDMSSSTSQTITTPNGTNALSLSGFRYWQIVVNLSTTVETNVPIMGTPVLTFSTTATWVSQPIHATTDNTGWGTLTFVGSTPAGTNISVAISTSPDNITYSSFGPISGAATEPWAKIRFILSTDAGDTVSPALSEITLTWNLTSTIESSSIDTGVTPVGFSTMQFVQSNPGVGTVQMFIRTATTALGLASATYVLVPNGTFPALTPDEFVQTKLVLTSGANASPQITSITVSWFISSGTVSVRCASLFYNKTYYLAVATIGATANDILIELDQFGKWRIQTGQSVGTLLLYFNTLYFSDGINSNIYNGFIAPTDNGTAITMDVRTKAWQETDDIFLKVPRAIKVTGIHTGTLIHAYYSTDRGNTFVEMFNELGTFGYQTLLTGLEFVTLFAPDADTLEPGRTLMYRLVSADVFPCSISKIEPTMYARKGRYLNNG